MKITDSVKRKADLAFSVVFGIFVIGVLIYHFNKDSSVAKYRTEIIGKIIDFKHTKNFTYSLIYEYKVSDKTYTGRVATEFFKCANGTKGCVGKKVKVFYSSKEPEYSQVNLGNYEKHRTTIYLNK